MDEAARKATDAGGLSATTAVLDHLAAERDAQLGTLQIHDWVGTVIHRIELGRAPGRSDAGVARGEILVDVQLPCSAVLANGLGLPVGVGIPTDHPMAATARALTPLETVRFSGEPVLASNGKLTFGDVSAAGKLLAAKILIQFSALEEVKKGSP
jgi:hypothetical protein